MGVVLGGVLVGGFVGLQGSGASRMGRVILETGSGTFRKERVGSRGNGTSRRGVVGSGIGGGAFREGRVVV